nr:M-phase inducer phosphatase-like [Dermatophagoides farinae]
MIIMDNDHQQQMNNNDSTKTNSIHHHHHYQKHRRTILHEMDEIMHKSGIIIRPTKVTVPSTESQNIWKKNLKNHGDFHPDASTINHTSLLSSTLYTPTMNPYNQSIIPVTMNSLHSKHKCSYHFRQTKRKRKRRSMDHSNESSNNNNDDGSGEYDKVTLDFGIQRHQNQSCHYGHHNKYGYDHKQQNQFSAVNDADAKYDFSYLNDDDHDQDDHDYYVDDDDLNDHDQIRFSVVAGNGINFHYCRCCMKKSTISYDQLNHHHYHRYCSIILSKSYRIQLLEDCHNVHLTKIERQKQNKNSNDSIYYDELNLAPIQFDQTFYWSSLITKLTTTATTTNVSKCQRNFARDNDEICDDDQWLLNDNSVDYDHDGKSLQNCHPVDFIMIGFKIIININDKNNNNYDYFRQPQEFLPNQFGHLNSHHNNQIDLNNYDHGNDFEFCQQQQQQHQRLERKIEKFCLHYRQHRRRRKYLQSSLTSINNINHDDDDDDYVDEDNFKYDKQFYISDDDDDDDDNDNNEIIDNKSSNILLFFNNYCHCHRDGYCDCVFGEKFFDYDNSIFVTIGDDVEDDEAPLFLKLQLLEFPVFNIKTVYIQNDYCVDKNNQHKQLKTSVQSTNNNSFCVNFRNKFYIKNLNNNFNDEFDDLNHKNNDGGTFVKTITLSKDDYYFHYYYTHNTNQNDDSHGDDGHEKNRKFNLITFHTLKQHLKFELKPKATAKIIINESRCYLQPHSSTSKYLTFLESSNIFNGINVNKTSSSSVQLLSPSPSSLNLKSTTISNLTTTKTEYKLFATDNETNRNIHHNPSSSSNTSSSTLTFASIDHNFNKNNPTVCRFDGNNQKHQNSFSSSSLSTSKNYFSFETFKRPALKSSIQRPCSSSSNFEHVWFYLLIFILIITFFTSPFACSSTLTSTLIQKLSKSRISTSSTASTLTTILAMPNSISSSSSSLSSLLLPSMAKTFNSTNHKMMDKTTADTRTSLLNATTTTTTTSSSTMNEIKENQNASIIDATTTMMTTMTTTTTATKSVVDNDMSATNPVKMIDTNVEANLVRVTKTETKMISKWKRVKMKSEKSTKSTTIEQPSYPYSPFNRGYVHHSNPKILSSSIMNNNKQNSELIAKNNIDNDIDLNNRDDEYINYKSSRNYNNISHYVEIENEGTVIHLPEDDTSKFSPSMIMASNGSMIRSDDDGHLIRLMRTVMRPIMITANNERRSQSSSPSSSTAIVRDDNDH